MYLRHLDPYYIMLRGYGLGVHSERLSCHWTRSYDAAGDHGCDMHMQHCSMNRDYTEIESFEDAAQGSFVTY